MTSSGTQASRTSRRHVTTQVSRVPAARHGSGTSLRRDWVAGEAAHSTRTIGGASDKRDLWAESVDHLGSMIVDCHC
jgi:hypothetical protein